MNSSVTMTAVGDIMFSENRGTGAVIRKHGPVYPFSKIKNLMEADILFGNLESPISSRGRPFPRQDSHITFRANPKSVEGLTACKFDIVSLANNHATDYGPEAFLDTLDTLEENGIKYVGGGRNLAEAEGAVILERNGIRIGFLAFSSFIMFATSPATRSQCGIAHFNIRRVRKRILETRSAADIVIVSVHWGLDFTEYPVPIHMDYARDMIDSGAHIIIGHHSHYLQGIEHYKDGVIAYSLGDFIFDEPGRETCLLKFGISAGGIEDVEILPARISDDLQTEPVDGPDGARIIGKVNDLSRAYRNYEPERARRMTDDYIICNLYIFLKSGNMNVFRNLTSPLIIWRLATLPVRKIMSKLHRLLRLEKGAP